MKADFSGYATKSGLLCSDGRTIAPGAFRQQNQMQVPLVWQHQHKDPEMILGHAILEDRDGDIYAYAFFNDSPKAQHAKTLIEHGDIKMLSIWANELLERGKKVLHGAIREVSLVISGANPGAMIDNIALRHGDGVEYLDDEAIIYTGLEIEHEQLSHAEGDTEDKEDEEDGETIQDIFDTLNEKQKEAVSYMLGQAFVAEVPDEETTEGGDAKQDNLGDQTDDDEQTIEHSNQEGTEMTRTNVFEQDKEKNGEQSTTLSHAETKGLMADALATAVATGRSFRAELKDAAELKHGIQNLELLFPEAQNITNVPEWDKRRTEWVAAVLGGANKTPFSRIRTWTADITYDAARAKGYIKGNMKKEEFFSISRRVTTPQTIYKKQKLDRDDIIDITDFDVVAWMKGEMRLMLDEELARAVLIGDGREVDDDDKIREEHIRPIAKDDPYYTIMVPADTGDWEGVHDAIILARQFYKGSGNPTMFTTENFIANSLLVRDGNGRKVYNNLSELVTTLRVSSIVAVEVLDDDPEILAILVNMRDYTIGADKGGKVTMFDDFDIDFNQEKYLIETRCSGALTKPKSAMVVYNATGDTLRVPVAPTYDDATGTITVATTVGVEYRNRAGVEVSGDAIVLAEGTNEKITAMPAAGSQIAAGKNSWAFLRPPSA